MNQLLVTGKMPKELGALPKMAKKPITRARLERIMKENTQAILPVSGDCLEGAQVMAGGWVCIDFTRRPAPPRYKNKGGDGSFDLCLCWTVFPGQHRPAVMLKKFLGYWGNMCMVGTQYAPWKGGEFRMDCGMEALEVFGVILASWDPSGRLLWQRDPESFPEELGTTPAIHGVDIGNPVPVQKQLSAGPGRRAPGAC